MPGLDDNAAVQPSIVDGSFIGIAVQISDVCRDLLAFDGIAAAVIQTARLSVTCAGLAITSVMAVAVGSQREAVLVLVIAREGECSP